MSMKMNRSAYEQLVEGNLAWLRAQPRTLERDHIIAIVEQSPEWLYPNADGHHDYHGLDTPERVRFYEHDFYVLSNFSAFSVRVNRYPFATAEHAYHFAKFEPETLVDGWYVRDRIRAAVSAHEAFKLAEGWRDHVRPDWMEVRVGVMREILRAKVEQHEYVKRKLLATGDRELVEDSWRDSFWGWGPNRDGQNMLGKLWMELRAELRTKESTR